MISTSTNHQNSKKQDIPKEQDAHTISDSHYISLT